MSFSFNGLNQWFLEEQGQRLAHHIKTSSSPIFNALKGETFLQLGIEEHQSWLDDSPILKKIVCISYPGKHKASVISSLYELPFNTGSMNVIFCPFTYNMLHDKQAFISEVDRVLSPDGTIIFLGINPFSFWGSPRQWYGQSRMPELVSIHKLRRQLVESGYLIKEVERFIYWPPFVSTIFLERIFEKVGQMILPYPAGFYLLTAKKNIFKPILNKSPLYFEKTYS